MLLRALATLFSISAAGLASAQCTGVSYIDTLSADQMAQLDTATATMPFARGLAYDATRGDKKLTLVGTMHIYDPRLGPVFDRIADDLDSADLILLEATADDQTAFQALLAEQPDMFMITDGPTLPDLLDAETWQQLSDAASERGVPGFMAAQMQPWYLSLVLAIPPCALADLATGAEGLDGMIGDYAARTGVPMQSLEDLTTVFEVFQTGTFEEQLNMLRISLGAPALQQQLFVATLDSYFTGQIGRLWEISRLAVAEAPGLDPQTAATVFAEMEDGLLTRRNASWIPVIEAAAQTHDDIVAAFGAAHLIGQTGVLQLLVDAGWDVQPRF